jgi:hypothetical protein
MMEKMIGIHWLTFKKVTIASVLLAIIVDLKAGVLLEVGTLTIDYAHNHMIKKLP